MRGFGRGDGRACAAGLTVAHGAPDTRYSTRSGIRLDGGEICTRSRVCGPDLGYVWRCGVFNILFGRAFWRLRGLCASMRRAPRRAGGADLRGRRAYRRALFARRYAAPREIRLQLSVLARSARARMCVLAGSERFRPVRYCTVRMRTTPVLGSPVRRFACSCRRQPVGSRACARPGTALPGSQRFQASRRRAAWPVWCVAPGRRWTCLRNAPRRRTQSSLAAVRPEQGCSGEPVLPSRRARPPFTASPCSFYSIMIFIQYCCWAANYFLQHHWCRVWNAGLTFRIFCSHHHHFTERTRAGAIVQ